MAKDKPKKKGKKGKKKNAQALPPPITSPAPAPDAAAAQRPEAEPETKPGRPRTPVQHCLHCKQPMIHNGNDRPLVDPNGQWICAAAPKANSLHTTL